MLKQIEIQYREGEDGMLYPILDYPKQTEGDIGKYGRMRLEYLQNHRKAIYAQMRLAGNLKQHLLDINEQAHNLLSQMVEQMAVQEGIAEKLKATNQLEWIRSMNSIRHRAEEITKADLIFK